VFERSAHKVSWRDRKGGTWEIETRAAFIGGRWELVGLSIQPLDPARVLTSSVLSQLRLPEFFTAHQRAKYRELMAKHKGWEFRATPQNLAGTMTLGGRPVAAPGVRRFRSLMADMPGTPRVGRPREWTLERLDEVGRIYRKAWSALPRENPTAAVKEHFHLSSSGAGRAVKLARAGGFLPPTTPGKAGWNETTPGKGRQSAKERKR
jgi:hypothetical protein